MNWKYWAAVMSSVATLNITLLPGEDCAVIYVYTYRTGRRSLPVLAGTVVVNRCPGGQAAGCLWLEYTASSGGNIRPEAGTELTSAAAQ